MSAWEGSAYGERMNDKWMKEGRHPVNKDEKPVTSQPKEDKDLFIHLEIPVADMKIIWRNACVWNDDIKPHFYKAMIRGYLLAKGKLATVYGDLDL
jgi:hypothetical protein